MHMGGCGKNLKEQPPAILYMSPTSDCVMRSVPNEKKRLEKASKKKEQKKRQQENR